MSSKRLHMIAESAAGKTDLEGGLNEPKKKLSSTQKKLKTQDATANTEIASLKAELKERAEQIALMGMKMDVLSKQLEIKTNEAKELELEVDELREDLEFEQDQLEKVEKELQHNKEKNTLIERLQIGIRYKDNLIEELKKEKSDFAQKFQQLQADKRSLEELVHCYGSQITAVKKTNDHLLSVLNLLSPNQYFQTDRNQAICEQFAHFQINQPVNAVSSLISGQTDLASLTNPALPGTDQPVSPFCSHHAKLVSSSPAGQYQPILALPPLEHPHSTVFAADSAPADLSFYTASEMVNEVDR